MMGATRTVRIPTAAAIDDAHARVATLVPLSPLVASPVTADNCWLKLETLQPTGSFKIRGAVAALSRLPSAMPVVTCSAGNHGLATAYVASRLGRHASIVVSEKCSSRKIELLRRAADELLVHGSNYDEAEIHARRVAADRRAHFLSPYNDPDVILGQASIGVELLRQFSEEITVVCPVGGGGLAAGVALALSRRSGCTLIGVEAAQSAPMRVALAHGSVVPIDIGETLADGLAGNLEDGTVTVELLAKHAVGMLSVTETQITHAMRHLAVAHGLMVEGAGAVAVAAILAGIVPWRRDRPVVALVTGRNIDLSTWMAAVQSGTSDPRV